MDPGKTAQQKLVRRNFCGMGKSLGLVFAYGKSLFNGNLKLFVELGNMQLLSSHYKP